MTRSAAKAAPGDIDPSAAKMHAAANFAFPLMASSLPVSEIRLVRSRDLSVLVGAVLVRIFGADIFQPRAQRAPISDRRGPGRREYAFILDGEEELQVLAPVVGIHIERFDRRIDDAGAEILFCVALQPFSCGFVIQ